MAHLSGVLLIECPASALNNAGAMLDMERASRYGNWAAIKKIRTREGVFPYVSAQAFRGWLRESLRSVSGWTPSPTFREEDVAYTDANPILYAEDDLFGYMRAPGGTGKERLTAKRAKWNSQGLSDQESTKSKDKEKFMALTRSSPFKVSTLISISGLNPSSIGYDYGNMSRFDDKENAGPVPFEHEFYRTTLVGLFSVDLRMLGRFYHIQRTGYKHLDSVRKELAEKEGLETYDDGKAFQLSMTQRKERLRLLLQGLARISGGAKQALHYTDVTPRLLMMGVAKGGNHLFSTVVGADSKGLPKVNYEALKEVARVYRVDLRSSIYTGLMQGYLDDQREPLQQTLSALELAFRRKPTVLHPVEAIEALVADLDSNGESWLE